MLDESEIHHLAETIRDEVYIPSVLYRLQFNKEFTFAQAAEIVEYLKELGVDTVYSSPYLKAVSGSAHGYNVVDPTMINPEVGSRESYNLFCDRIRELGMGQILDVVPNHMGIGPENNLWMDVLEHGSNSRYAFFFDIDWEPAKSALHHKLLLPILGEQFGKVLESGKIRLEYGEGRFRLRYYQAVFPVDPGSYDLILSRDLEGLQEKMGKSNRQYDRFLSLITAYRRLPNQRILSEEEREERYRESWSASERLGWFYNEDADIREYVDCGVRRINGTAGDPASFDLLEALLDRQCYRLASWHVAGEEINYRRFFDVNELAAIRIEDPQVFHYCHRLIFELVREGRVQGLRIDHSDGLYDPQGYFRMLQLSYILQELQERIVLGRPPLTDRENELLQLEVSRMGRLARLPLYLIIEKILDRKESLPKEWMVHGTVGYDYLNMLNRLFIKRENEAEFDSIYMNFTRLKTDFESLLHKKKRLFARGHMPGEINVLAQRLARITERSRRYRDFTLNNLRSAIRELIAFFPVYRTYIGPRDREVTEWDKKYIHIATEKAKSYNSDLSNTLFDFIRDILLLRFDEGLSRTERDLYQDFILRFQQITSPIMAKGVEDTAFYVGNRFISLNEVGGDPAHFGCSIAEFHKENMELHASWPYATNCTSTHDTKRSEDVRQRLNVISEIPGEWRRYLKRWSRITGKFKTMTEKGLSPDRNTEYFIYQTLVGMWPDYPIPADYRPAFIDRVWTYIHKAIREAKTHTSWIKPDLQYEAAAQKFLEQLLRPKRNYFLKLFQEFQQKIASCGKYNSLAAINLRTGSPGVMDNYQGTELWDYSLVDPDNRRAVDYALRRHLLYRVRELCSHGATIEEIAGELLSEKRDSRIKIFTLWKGLNFRSTHKELFLDGEYLPLETSGALADHITAFLRRRGNGVALVSSGRFFWDLSSREETPPVGDVWGDTAILLPSDPGSGVMRDVYTGQAPHRERTPSGEYIRAAELFRYFPFALLSNLTAIKEQEGVSDA